MIIVDEKKNVRKVYDDMNPRIYQNEYRCKSCNEWIEEEETVWVDFDAFHVGCAPNQY